MAGMFGRDRPHEKWVVVDGGYRLNPYYEKPPYDIGLGGAILLGPLLGAAAAGGTAAGITRGMAAAAKRYGQRPSSRLPKGDPEGILEGVKSVWEKIPWAGSEPVPEVRIEPKRRRDPRDIWAKSEPVPDDWIERKRERERQWQEERSRGRR